MKKIDPQSFLYYYEGVEPWTIVREYQDDAARIVEVEKGLMHIEGLKWDYASKLYELVDSFAETYEEIERGCDTETRDPSFLRKRIKKFGKLTCRQMAREVVGAPARAVAKKAINLCGSSLKTFEFLQ